MEVELKNKSNSEEMGNGGNNTPIGISTTNLFGAGMMGQLGATNNMKHLYIKPDPDTNLMMLLQNPSMLDSFRTFNSVHLLKFHYIYNARFV